MVKKNSYVIIITLIMLSLLITVVIPNYSYGTGPIENPGGYKPTDPSTTDIAPIASKGGIILDVITTIGIVVAVLVLIILGIKYMVGSVEEKAEYKKTMIPYLIGVIMVGSISTIIKVIATNITF